MIFSLLGQWRRGRPFFASQYWALRDKCRLMYFNLRFFVRRSINGCSPLASVFEVNSTAETDVFIPIFGLNTGLNKWGNSSRNPPETAQKNGLSFSINRWFYCDSDRIQTCNLLIRSQVLYSVKLRSHSLIASANVGYFSGLCKFFADKIYPTRKMALRKSGVSAVAGFCGRWAAERVRGSHGGKSGSRQGGVSAMRE